MLMFRNKSYDVVLNTSIALLLLIFCISQDSVVTHLRCGGKYVTNLVANLLLSPAVKEFLKSANISQTCERISSGTFLWPTVYNNMTAVIMFGKCPRPVNRRTSVFIYRSRALSLQS